ncbi:MAG TPA: hypothetical protein VM266_13950, partial [Solirubrobacteraceae bacterium]|nr:hypothetical protein [Solirubrobacteraceae bacterium]
MRRSFIAIAAIALTASVTAPTAAGHPGDPLASASNVQHVDHDGNFTGGHVVRQGDRLYVGAYGLGLQIFSIADTAPDPNDGPTNPRLIGRYMPGRVVADAPPDAAVFDGRHIAVLNGTGRTSRNLPPGVTRTDNSYFIDATDPTSPKLLWTFEGAHDGEAHNGDIVDERRLWLPSGGRNLTEGGTAGKNGLRIYDLNPLLEQPAQKPAVLFRGDPVELWRDSPHRAGRDVGPAWDHTHDVTVYPDFRGSGRDIALLVEGGAYTNDAGNTGSLFVIDITDPRQPVVLNRWRHESGHGHKPIRYFHEAQFLDGDQSVVLVSDEDLHNGCDAGGVTALRVSDDLTRVESELSQWFIGADGDFAPICSVHVFSTHGNLAFFGSYNAGLQVVDYSDPTRPRRVGHAVETGSDAWGAEYFEDGLVYVGDFGGRGLDTFRYVGPRPDLSI